MIIGICGYAGVGKSTAASFLNLPVYSFATTIKKDLNKSLEVYGYNLFSSDKHKFRELMIAYARCWRKINSNFFIKKLFEQNLPENFVIDDVRYKDEALEILRRGGVLLLIEKEGIGAFHQEELTVNDIYSLNPHIIKNNSTKEELRGLVISWYTKL